MQAKINGTYVTTTPSVKIEGIYKPVTNTYVKIEGIYKPVRSLQECFAYNFDGIDDYGVLQDRAVNPDGDNTFEFWSPSTSANSPAIMSQNVSGNESLQEFRISVTSAVSLILVYGGANNLLCTAAQGFRLNARYGLALTNNTFTIYEGGLGGSVVRTGTFTRGAAREPAALTRVGTRSNGTGIFANFFQGPQYDIAINGTLWSMVDRNQVIQPSIPAGNNMTLANTTSDRWEEVACNLRVTP